MSRVVVTGMGCISGLGPNLTESWAALIAGDGAIQAWDPGDGSEALPAARVDPAWTASALAGRDLRHLGKLDLLSAFALAAATEAVAQAGLLGHPVLQADTAILLGCGSGGNATIDAAFERLYRKGAERVHPQTIPSSMISAPASHLSMLLGAHGPVYVLSSACASSAHAIG